MAAAFTPTFLYLTGGLIIWAIRFLAAYSVTALACARGWSASAGGLGTIQLVVIALSAVALAGCAAILLRALAHLRSNSSEAEDNERFIHHVAAGVAALAAFAIIWEGVPFFLIPVCK